MDSICFWAFLIFLPQALQVALRKYWASLHRVFSHLIMRNLPQESHRSLPTKVGPPQSGQVVVSGAPHPEQTALPRSISFKQWGQ